MRFFYLFRVFVFSISILLVNRIQLIGQNSVLITPDTTNNQAAKILSQGVGRFSDKLQLNESESSYTQFESTRVGVKSISSTKTTAGQTMIYGKSTHSSTLNIGIAAESSNTGLAKGVGGFFSTYGNTSNTNYGIYVSSSNRSSVGATFAGYFKVLNFPGRSGERSGVMIENKVAWNDTSRAASRVGLKVELAGKSSQTDYGIYAINGANTDTVSTDDLKVGAYSATFAKNSYSVIGNMGYSDNVGKGPSIGGYFASRAEAATSTAGVFKVLGAKSTESKIGINILNLGIQNDTTRVNEIYGLVSKVNGRSANSMISVLGMNNNADDTLSTYERIGVSGSALGRSTYRNVGIEGVASNDTFHEAKSVGVSGIAFNENTSGAVGGEFTATIDKKPSGYSTILGIRGSAYSYNTLDNSNVYGGVLDAYSVGNNNSYGAYITNSSQSPSGTQVGLFSSVYLDNSANNNYAAAIVANVSGTKSGTVYGIYSYVPTLTNSYAGYFNGNVHINGNLSKSGGTFKIDHPQDPTHKYLIHGFVESPEMTNIYSGNIVTDLEGYAWVELPAYFEALNKDFKYQLTPIGKLSMVAVIEKIKNNKFLIQSSLPNVEISWQVSGIRNDVWAKANPIIVESWKEKENQGKYLNPEVYGKQRVNTMQGSISSSNALLNASSKQNLSNTTHGKLSNNNGTELYKNIDENNLKYRRKN